MKRKPSPVGVIPQPPAIVAEQNLSTAQWGMISFLVSEVAFFATLIVTFVTFMGYETVGPTAREALSLPIVIAASICLLSSSVTVHFAELALHRGSQRTFCVLWASTIALAIVFLAATAYEWYELITEHHLTISRNMFGTTYYTLIGFHAFHVSVGVIAMIIVLGLALRRKVTAHNQSGVQLISWYWHFVDAVWIIVFLVVYVAARGGL